MTIKHWTDDHVDWTFYINNEQIEARREMLGDNAYKVFARYPGAKGWLLCSTVTETIPLADSTRREHVRSLVRMFANDLPRV